MMTFLRTFVACGLAAIGTAHAQQGYAGAWIGASNVTEDTVTANDPFFGPMETAAEYDDGVALGLFAGWRFNPLMAGEIEMTGQTNDSDVFYGEETFSVTSFFLNGVLSTPADQVFTLWIGAGAGFAATNIEDGGAAFANQLKAGIDFRIAGPHRIGIQATSMRADTFEGRQDGVDFDVDYEANTLGLSYRYNF